MARGSEASAMFAAVDVDVDVCVDGVDVSRLEAQGITLRRELYVGSWAE